MRGDAAETRDIETRMGRRIVVKRMAISDAEREVKGIQVLERGGRITEGPGEERERNPLGFCIAIGLVPGKYVLACNANMFDRAGPISTVGNGKSGDSQDVSGEGRGVSHVFRMTVEGVRFRLVSLR